MMFKEQRVVLHAFNSSILGTEARLYYIEGPGIGNPNTNSCLDNI